MVPLREAIDNGLWLKAEFIEEVYIEDESSKEITFQVKPLSLTKINLAEEVDEPIKLEKIGIDSNVWLLKIDVVNLCRKKIDSYVLHDRLLILDEDNFEFPSFRDGHLSYISDFAQESGLDKFFDANLSPKVRRRGALSFELPDHFDELYISIRDGSLIEA